VRSAPLYRSAPIGPEQPAFLNTAVCVSVDDGRPEELIESLLTLERVLGRTRESEARWGPRAIDLDLLVWGARRIRSPRLEVPHPRLAERKFALAPLVALLGPAFDVPGLGPAGELLQRVADQHCDEVAPSW
jgi:2-amino-4-hydroxy-6-hydroxymethyldihydropteridine diphosphokinase